jgi:HEAT repeat protein
MKKSRAVSRSRRRRTDRPMVRMRLPSQPPRRANHRRWLALGLATLFFMGFASWVFHGVSPKSGFEIQALASTDSAIRVDAIHRIVQGPMNHEALSAITTCLSDSDSRVRHEAITAIARLDPGISLVPLLGALADPDESIRQLASESLAALEASPAAEAAWREAFASNMQSVRVRAVEHIDSGATPQMLLERLRMALDDQSAEVRSAASVSLVTSTSEQFERALPLLRAHLDNDDPNVREGVLAALHDRSVPADMVPVLVASLHSHFPEVRQYAIKTLASLNQPDSAAASALCMLLGDRVPKNRELASAALVRLGPLAVPALREALRSHDREVRVEAIRTLSAVGINSADAVPDLIVLLDDWSADVRAQAAKTLGGMGTDAQVALTTLAAHFSDPDHSVRRQSLDAALKIGPRSFMAAPFLAALDSDDPETVQLASSAIGRLGQLDESAVPALRRATNGRRADVRLFAIQSLASLGPKAKDAVPELRAALNDADARVREQALNALSQLGSGSGTTGALAAALTTADTKLRDAAALALNRAPSVDASAVSPLIQALGSRTPGIRQIAARSLGKAGTAAKDATPALEQALKDPDPNVRREAATAIGRIGLPAWRAVPKLAAALEDGSMSVRRAAVGALVVLAPRTNNTVFYLLGAARQPELRRQAFDGLVAAGPAAVPELLVAIDNREQYDARILAMAALAKLGPEAREAADALEYLARRHPYPGLRHTAAYALRSVLGEQPPGMPDSLPVSFENREPRRRPANEKTSQPTSSTIQLADGAGPMGPPRPACKQ